MKKHILLSMIAAIGLCASACSNQAVSPESTPATSEATTIVDHSETAAPSVEQNTSNSSTHSKEFPRQLNFVDAFGQNYVMDIHPDIPKSPYKKDAFLLNGSQMTYSDDSYRTRLGIDVSYYQGDIDWEKVAAAGYEFAFIRVGFRGYGEEGLLKPDTNFHINIQNAQAAGLDVGVYFFSQAVNETEAIEEASFVLEQLEGYTLQMPVVYDPESILHTESRTDDVTGEQFTKNSQAFCKTIEHAGYEPMLYCNLLWQAFELDLTKLAEIPIWYADYEEKPQTPYAFEIWQYSEKGQVDGIAGNVDLNIQMIKER